jgi:hypothetical protein
MVFLAKLATGVAGVALIGGTVLTSEGFIHVKVHEKQPGGTNIYVVAPAALVNATLEFVPNRHLAEASENLRPYLPIINAAIQALGDSPDGILVEVLDADDHILVRKSGGSIVVDVNDAQDTVHVSVPLRAAQSAIHEIVAANHLLP